MSDISDQSASVPAEPADPTAMNFIRLDQFLKLIGIAPTGGTAKVMIQMGDVFVNGELETRRGRKLVTGDRVTIAGQSFAVDLPPS